MSKIKINIKQNGAIELTQNIGSDSTYKIPITITSDNNDFNKAVSSVNELRYEDSYSEWAYMSNGKETFIDDLFTDTESDWYEEGIDVFQSEMSRFGMETLAGVFTYVEKDWKPQEDTDIKILSVTYIVRTCEHKFIGHTIRTGSKNEKDENIIHKFFLDFYGENDLVEWVKASNYSYCGQINIKNIYWVEITEKDKIVLNKVGIL